MKKISFLKTLAFALLLFSFSLSAWSQVVISQVYGGGGNSGATLKNDFIEIFNQSSEPVNLAGWSVQYASSTGTSWQVTQLTDFTLQPGQYYLVQQAQGSGGTVDLPTPDATGTMAMAASNGKVALVNNTTALSGSCPTGSEVIDLVGYGTANCFEGSGATAPISNTTAAIRLDDGCVDTNNNNADFVVETPNPSNTASPVHVCSTTPSVAMPSFDPAPGMYTSPIDVTISTTTEGASIYYTLDGNDPTEASTLYTGPVNISSTTTIKARGYKAGLDPSYVATGVYAFPTTVSTIAELKQLPTGSTPYILSGEATLTYQQDFRNQKYIEDETGGILIDDNSGIITSAYSLYDGITGIEGTLTVYGNMFQFTPLSDPGPATSTNNVIEPLEISLAEFVNNFETYESRLVTIQNVSFVSPGGNFENGQTYSITDGITTATLRTTFYDVDYIGTPIPTNPFHLTGLPNSRAEGDFITPRFLSDFNFDLISTDASLSALTLGGLDALDLTGVEVNDPSEEGATIFVSDFTDFEGIVVTTSHPAATFAVSLNGDPVDEADLPTQALFSGDVVVVTVVAEDETTTKYYKVTLTDEIRELAFTAPIGGEEYETGEPVTVSWTSENIQTLNLYVYQAGFSTPVAEYTDITAANGTFTENLPNGAHGSYYFRLSDASDLNFYAESANVTFIDILDPEVLALTPENNAVEVPADQGFIITVSENIWPVSGKNIIIYTSSDDAIVETISSTSSQVNIEDNQIHINPSNDLAFETAYYILVDEGAFADLGGNTLPGIAEGEWSFTIGTEPVIEVICNGDFENWTDGKPDCWFGAKTNLVAAAVMQYTENPQSGSSAVQLINAEGNHKRFTSQATSVENGQNYRVTFWLKGKGDIRTGLFDEREDAYGYFYNEYIIVNSDTWAEYSQVILAENSSDVAEFIFSLRNSDEAMGHLQLDNVSVEVISNEATQVSNLLALRGGETGMPYQLTGEAILTYQQNFRNQKYIQDNSAAIVIDDFDGVISTNYDIGDGITGITGTLTINNGMLQFVPTEDPGAATSTGNPVVPEVRTLASLTSDDQAKLVKIENVSFANASGNFATSQNYELTSANGNGVFRTSFFDADYIGTAVPVQPQNLSVLVSQYLTTIQVTARDLDDFELSTSVTLTEMPAVSIYPNPFSDHIRLLNLEQIDIVRLVNSSGQIVREYEAVDGDLQIGTSSLERGLYIIQLIDKTGQVYVRKMIRQ
ncbi:MAG: chitobiase/beta-hexosaminidase C-terminal domain-containing protein [Bacteroides sp.]|nr:chitobiase/beta-hexosaminidase C-terminal domain-containing protein [Bacteroides sp.]